MFFWRLNHGTCVSSLELSGSAITSVVCSTYFHCRSKQRSELVHVCRGIRFPHSWAFEISVKNVKGLIMFCEAKVLPLVGRKCFMASGGREPLKHCGYDGWAAPAWQVWPVFPQLSWLSLLTCTNERSSLGKNGRKGKNQRAMIPPFRHLFRVQLPMLVVTVTEFIKPYFVDVLLRLVQVTTVVSKAGALNLRFSFYALLLFFCVYNPC